MHSRTARGPTRRPDAVFVGPDRRRAGVGGRHARLGLAAVHGALCDQHERRHRPRREHADDVPARHRRDADAGGLRRRRRRAPRRRQLLPDGLRRRRRRPATANSSSANLEHPGGRDGPLRRPLLGRGARPGRDAAAAVRRDRRARAIRPSTRPRPARPGCRRRAAATSPSTRACSTSTPRTSAAATRPGSTSARATRPSPTSPRSCRPAAGARTRSPTSRPAPGADRHAGWSLVVAYQDVAQPARNLTIFDGLAQVDNGNRP